jgi:hypothetical protein
VHAPAATIGVDALSERPASITVASTWEALRYIVAAAIGERELLVGEVGRARSRAPRWWVPRSASGVEEGRWQSVSMIRVAPLMRVKRSTSALGRPQTLVRTALKLHALAWGSYLGKHLTELHTGNPVVGSGPVTPST